MLKSSKELRYFGDTSYTHLRTAGNIHLPSVGNLLKMAANSSFLDQIILYLVYIFWFLSQIILLVILLNFVIALISQYYEDVMNSQVMHNYVMKQTLNR